MEQRPTEVLGVDIGQVIIEQRPKDQNLIFRGPNYLNSPEMPDAFRVLRRLRDERFGENILLVTRCWRVVQEKRIEWLDHHNFYERIGIPRVRPLYCWTPQYKAVVCRNLFISHFIDDDPRELIHLGGLIPNLILFRPDQRYVDEYARFVEQDTIRVESWQEIEKLLLP